MCTSPELPLSEKWQQHEPGGYLLNPMQTGLFKGFKRFDTLIQFLIKITEQDVKEDFCWTFLVKKKTFKTISHQHSCYVVCLRLRVFSPNVHECSET